MGYPSEAAAIGAPEKAIRSALTRTRARGGSRWTLHKLVKNTIIARIHPDAAIYAINTILSKFVN